MLRTAMPSKQWISQLEQLVKSLPRLSEAQLATFADGGEFLVYFFIEFCSSLRVKDAACPICMTPFHAVVASEELAQAMDSPAAILEDMGVTRLEKTCGHMFCRKECASCSRSLLRLTLLALQHHYMDPWCGVYSASDMSAICEYYF